MPLLYGMHDLEGLSITPNGGWVLALCELGAKPSGMHFKEYRDDVNYLVRLHWRFGEGGGCIPLTEEWDEYLGNLESYLSQTSGVSGLIVGNEMNHPQERPKGIYLEPEYYAEFYSRVDELVRGRFALAPGAPAPYRMDGGEPWHRYGLRVNNQIKALGMTPDFLACHAYTRGPNPAQVRSMQKMDAPLEDCYSGFYTFLDFINKCVPEEWEHLPLHITEFNEYEPWLDANTGVIEEAYRTVHHYNQALERGNPIDSLLLYRYPQYDKWAIQGKMGVIEDFLEATNFGYHSASESPQKPVDDPQSLDTKIYVPSIQKHPKVASSPTTPFIRDIDERAIRRGVRIVEVEGRTAWKVRSIQFLNKEEAQGTRNAFVDVLDEKGVRQVGKEVLFNWRSGELAKTTEEKQGQNYAVDYPLNPSQQNDFAVTVRVVDAVPSEVVTGLAMGLGTVHGYNPGIHTSYRVVFQLHEHREEPIQVGNELSELVHPVRNPAFRTITQPYGRGVNREYYSRFSVDGVPLEGHNGVDYATPVGSIIEAVDGGRAIEIGDDTGGYGLYVKLQHTWGESLYAHLSEALVTYNQIVSIGQQVGKSGNSGNSTGPHLHFGIRLFPYNRRDGMGGYSDPLPLLDFNDGGEVTDIPQVIKQVASEAGMDWKLLVSLAWAESSFRPEIPDGLFQIGDQAWQDFASKVGATDRNDALDNARVGAAYLKWLLQYFKQDEYTALVAWNHGINNVIDRVPPPAITLEFVNKVRHGRDLLGATLT